MDRDRPGNRFSSEVSSFSAIAVDVQAGSPSNQSSSAGPSSLQLIRGGVVARLGPVEQRIALDFLVDELLEFPMGELQQLDRLHQLRRHHQRLGLSELQSGGQRHYSILPPATPSLRQALASCNVFVGRV